MEAQPKRESRRLGHFYADLPSAGLGVQRAGGWRLTVLGLGAQNQSALACWTKSGTIPRKAEEVAVFHFITHKDGTHTSTHPRVHPVGPGC